MSVLNNREMMAVRLALAKERETLEQFSLSTEEPLACEYRRRLEMIEDLQEKFAPGARVIVGD